MILPLDPNKLIYLAILIVIAGISDAAKIETTLVIIPFILSFLNLDIQTAINISYIYNLS